MGRKGYTEDETGSPGPQTRSVEWDVSWQELTVRVMAQFAHSAREKGCVMINRIYKPTQIQSEHGPIMPGHKVGDVVPYPLSCMDVEAKLAFRPQAMDSVGYIIEKVCDYYGLEVEDVLEPGRAKTVAKARSVAMYLACTLTQLGLTEIAEQFNRHHRTVMQSRNAVQKQLAAVSEWEALKRSKGKRRAIKRQSLHLRNDVKKLLEHFPS